MHFWKKGFLIFRKNYAVKISVIWTCCSCCGSGNVFSFRFSISGEITISLIGNTHSAQMFFFAVPIVIGSIRYDIGCHGFSCRKSNRILKMSKTRYTNSSLYQVTKWLMNAFLPSQWGSFAFVFKCELNWICLWFFPLFHTFNVIILLQFFFK